MCPISNVRTAVTPDLSKHPLKKMLDLGLNVSINSDDPAYFGGYLMDNFKAAIQALSLTDEDVIRIIKNSFTASFLDEDKKAEWLSQLPICV
jgi:adenosine deaminase